MMQLEASEIHLWNVDSEDFDLQSLQAQCLGWLTNVELERYQRYQFDRHRKQLLLGRMLIRSVLSRYIETIEPASWQFQYNDYGKPSIHKAQQSIPLFFNLSHSANRLILAVAGFSELGVDIEACLKPRRVERIADRYFSKQEAKELLSLDKAEQLSRFYDLWTLKEAYIKACGLGLAIPLQQFTYSFLDAEKLAIQFDASRDDDENRWQLWQLQTAGDYKLALAAKNGERIKQISSWQLKSSSECEPIQALVVRSNLD